MDEGDGEDVAAVSQPEDILSQGKDSHEGCSILEPQERAIFREGDQSRSSIQQFVDILDGKDPISDVNIVRTSHEPEGSVQELTLGHNNGGHNAMNEGEMMETMLNKWHHEHATNKENCPTTSKALEGLNSAEVLGGKSSDQNDNFDPGQSNVLPTGDMRMKIISKSSGSEYPEYFVKSTLRGKGVICRGPISAGAHTTTSDPQVNVTGFDVGPSQESIKDGVSLREWMESGMRNLPKVERLLIFKQILDLVYSLHSEGKVLVDLRPSCFKLLSSRKVKYCGRVSVDPEMHGSINKKDVQKLQAMKRPLELGRSTYFDLGAKHQKVTDNVNFHKLNFMPTSAQQLVFSAVDQLEEKWYRNPEDGFGRACTCSSNIYCLGIFLFELLSSFHSGKVHAAAMSDLCHRILPPNFLSENPKEAGFCLWLLHPEPSLRPIARDILQSEVVSGFQALCADDKPSWSIRQDEDEMEVLSHFLVSMKEQKQKHLSKLVEDLGCVQADIKELEKRHLLRKQEDFLYATERGFLYSGNGLSSPVSDGRFQKNVAQLESAYFSTRSQIQVSGTDSLIRPDTDVLRTQESWYSDQEDEENQKSHDSLGDFFDGLCKYARYSKLEVCGTVRNRDITNSTNVICSLSFDRDEDYFAAAGVSKKIKIFELQALCDNSVDIHYPMIEMSNRSKISCVCWNNYIKNYLASTDYDGTVKLWDASTGQGFSQYTEHEKRAWCVDFSQLDPTKLASGSDDCTVKLWSINERKCLHTIQNIANVCCVQFSAHSSHLLAFGSADYKIYCYDLRYPNVLWCILAGHEKAVSYVKFVDSETLVSASTDNTLKLWDLKRSSSVGLSNNACSLTLSGHTNEKNFVGLSVAEGYIACGSETNEVYTYYKSLPLPIVSHKFGSIDPISGKETDDDNGQFVSSVCWKGKSNVLVAANSSGCIKVLRMV